VLLEFLAYQPGRVFSKEQLVEHLHRSDSEVSSNVVEVLVSHSRTSRSCRSRPYVADLDQPWPHLLDWRSDHDGTGRVMMAQHGADRDHRERRSVPGSQAGSDRALPYREGTRRDRLVPACLSISPGRWPWNV
jgi:hypothetical protein